MSPEAGNNGQPWKDRFITIPDNPLFEYLISLQRRRTALLDLLAPSRHYIWQLSVSTGIAVLWLIDLFVQSDALSGLPAVMVILVCPFIMIAGIFLPGWRWQMVVLQNYPSPLEYPNSLELLLATPLTEKEIVHGTIASYIVSPFIGFSFSRTFLWLLNVFLLYLFINSSGHRGTLPFEILTMSMKFYLPALCVFLFFPILTALDKLFLPYTWSNFMTTKYSNEKRSLISHSGRLPMLIMACVLVPIMIVINQYDQANQHSVMWILKAVCPLIILSLMTLSIILILFLPNHLAVIRRG